MLSALLSWMWNTVATRDGNSLLTHWSGKQSYLNVQGNVSIKEGTLTSDRSNKLFMTLVDALWQMNWPEREQKSLQV